MPTKAIYTSGDDFKTAVESVNNEINKLFTARLERANPLEHLTHAERLIAYYEQVALMTADLAAERGVEANEGQLEIIRHAANLHIALAHAKAVL